MKTVPQPVITDMKPRLVAAAAALADATEAATDARRLRDQLVVAAVDHGMSLRAVAAAAGVTSARVCAILAASQLDDDAGD
jgi:myo-inositol catabolism protein IolC